MAHRWIRLIGGIEIMVGAAGMMWPPLPSWLVGMLLVTGSLLVAFELPGIVQDVRHFFRALFMRGGIVWEFGGFLGGNWREGEAAFVSHFQVNGVNKKRSSLIINDAYIQSLLTFEIIPVKFKTDKGYSLASDINPIPSKVRVYAQALFYNPNKLNNSEREGLSEDKFISDWGKFIFSVGYAKKSFKRTFKQHQIEKQIARIKPSREPKPRVTQRVEHKESEKVEIKASVVLRLDGSLYEFVRSNNVLSVTDNGTGDISVNFTEQLNPDTMIINVTTGDGSVDYRIVEKSPDHIRLRFQAYEPTVFKIEVES